MKDVVDDEYVEEDYTGWCPSGDGDPNDGIDEPRINYSKQLAELLVIGQGEILIAASELLSHSVRVK